MTEVEPPEYGGIFLDPDEIKFDEIDPQLRSLIRRINSQPWIRTYGCCAGKAHHEEDPSDEHQFFIGVLVKSDQAGTSRLQSWVEEANRINGSTGLRLEVERVHKHPFGQGSVDGWSAYRLAIREIRKRKISMRPGTYRRMIKSLEAAWNRLPSASDQPL